MENKFRNELEITLGPEKLLLRPTFENIASMEAQVGSLQWIAYKFSRAGRVVDGKLLPTSEAGMKETLSLTDVAKIIFYNQAALNPNDDTKKKFSLEEIWEMVQAEGMRSANMQLLTYLSRIVSGNKFQADVSSAEKKS